jgi:uncharacterized protein YqgC (DUF456 family)
MSLILNALGLFLIFAGIVGLVIPLLPDVALISGGILLLLATRDALSAATVLPLIGLTLLALLADWLIVLYGARKLKASRAGTIGGLIGIALALNPFTIGFGGGAGLVVFPALGALVGELLGRPSARPFEALAISLGISLFVALGLAIKLILVGLILAIGLVAV